MSTGNPDVSRAEFDAALQRVAALEQEIAALEQHVGVWRTALQASSADVIAARIALLNDANGWAQHFSNVRLGVTTFLLAIALGIMQFQWATPTSLLTWTVAAIWGLAVVLFTYFTVQEYRKIGHIRLHKQSLLTIAGHTGAVRERTFRSDIPAYCLVILTVAFLMAWCEWHGRAGTLPTAPLSPSASPGPATTPTPAS